MKVGSVSLQRKPESEPNRNRDVDWIESVDSVHTVHVYRYMYMPGRDWTGLYGPNSWRWVAAKVNTRSGT